ncbi:MAG: hypothetical protein HRU38_14270 [Saccharospirillaceae bacterium]|nr:hypothetical protein [Pseudomonadales bacterium]NRB79808.1 hypothetical protein [Saccharospirillaceae bacterium]
MKKLYRFIFMFIISVSALNSYALEVNTSPFLSAVSGFKFNTLNVLINSGSGHVKWGPTIGLGKQSDTSVSFIGTRVEYNAVNFFYVASGASLGFIKQKNNPTLTVIPLLYVMGGAKVQYSNYVFKLGVGLTNPGLFSLVDDSSSLDDGESSSKIGPAFELKMGYSF